MRKPLGFNDDRKISYSVLGGLASLLFLVIAFALGVHAQPATDQRRALSEAKPFIVERQQIGEGTKTDPWLRFELRFGEPREKCRTWHFDVKGQADGHAVFDLKEPVDKSIILDSQFGPQHLEFVLGDADCNYRIRIERNK